MGKGMKFLNLRFFHICTVSLLPVLFFVLLSKPSFSAESSSEPNPCIRWVKAVFSRKPNPKRDLSVAWRNEFKNAEATGDLKLGAYALTKLILLSDRKSADPNFILGAGDFRLWLFPKINESLDPNHSKWLMRSESQALNSFKYYRKSKFYLPFLFRTIWSAAMDNFHREFQEIPFLTFAVLAAERARDPEFLKSIGLEEGPFVSRVVKFILHTVRLPAAKTYARKRYWARATPSMAGLLLLYLGSSATIQNPYLLPSIYLLASDFSGVYESERFIMEAARSDPALDPRDKSVGLIVDRNLLRDAVNPFSRMESRRPPFSSSEDAKNRLGELCLINHLACDMEVIVVGNKQEFQEALQKLKDRQLLYIFGHGLPEQLHMGGDWMANQMNGLSQSERPPGSGVVYISCLFGNCYPEKNRATNAEPWIALTKSLYPEGGFHAAAATESILMSGPTEEIPGAKEETAPTNQSNFSIWGAMLRAPLNIGAHMLRTVVRNGTGYNQLVGGYVFYQVSRNVWQESKRVYPAGLRVYDSDLDTAKFISTDSLSPREETEWGVFYRIRDDEKLSPEQRSQKLQKWAEKFVKIPPNLPQSNSKALKK